MKKYLPKLNNLKGFTLIELLVVIAIIAVLAVIGFAAFSGIQSRARDASRRADLKAIADALEVNKNSTGYQPITASQFGAGVLPGGGSIAVDPRGFAYCITPDPANNNMTIVDFGPADCDATGDGTGFSVIDGMVPLSNEPQYRVCTLLETGPVARRVFCLSNRQ